MEIDNILLDHGFDLGKHSRHSMCLLGVPAIRPEVSGKFNPSKTVLPLIRLSTLEPCVTTRAWFRWRAETNDLAPPIGHDGRPSRPQESSGNPPQFSGFQPYLGIIALIVCLVLLVLCSWSLDLTGPRLHSQIYAALLFVRRPRTSTSPPTRKRGQLTLF